MIDIVPARRGPLPHAASPALPTPTLLQCVGPVWLGFRSLPPNPHPEITQRLPYPTPNYYFEGARSGDGKGREGRNQTEDNPKGLTLPDDSTQLIIISLSLCLLCGSSVSPAPAAGGGVGRRGERLEGDSCGGRPAAPARGPRSLRLLDSQWRGPTAPSTRLLAS